MFMDGRLKPFEGKGLSHWVNNARVADLTCVLLHYKLLDGHLHQQVKEILTKDLGVQNYEKHLEVLDRDPSLRIKQESSKA